MSSELLPVVTATYRFDRVGALYVVGPQVNGRRPIRPVTAENPAPDLGDVRWPATYCDAAEVAAAFGVSFTAPASRVGEQLELFA